MKKTTTSECHFTYEEDHQRYRCEGPWTILHLNQVTERFRQTELPQGKTLQIKAHALKKMDSAGALALTECIRLLKRKKNKIELVDFTPEQLKLLDLIKEKQEVLHYKQPAPVQHNFLYSLGKETVHKINQFDGLIMLIGSLTDKLFVAFAQWRRFHPASIVSNIDSAGLKALPIVGLLAFLIGVVLAYELGLQLETYGANTFIAYLSGMAIFREFGPLITAIIIAGRTSSAFTAQIGSMKINEELDALNTMGLSPVELIVIPKVIGLLLIFPLLIFWADVFSLAGAMMMAKVKLQIGYIDFLTRLQDSVGLKHMMLGLYKAPAFAILIALVGCFQGFQVKANADSVGTQTTRSVVQALFLIIIADATYTIIYSWLKL